MANWLVFWKTSPYFRGAVWKICSYSCFSGINGIVRYLSQVAKASGTLPLPACEIAFFQSLLGLIFLIPWILHHGPSSLRTRLPGLQTCRILLSVLGMVLWYWSLAEMEISQAVALMFLGPLITTLGAKIFLKESLSPERSLAILIGFVGGAIVSHTTFSSGLLGLCSALPILAATCFSGATLMVRRLAHEDSPTLIVVYLLLFTAPILLIPTLVYGVWPLAWQWPWLMIMGACSAGAHLCLGKAFASAEVTYLIPFGFTKWFASTLIGVMIFAEIPSFWTCFGVFIIMSAIVFLSYRGARQRSRLAGPSL